MTKLDHDTSKCPYCKSENISSSLPETDTNMVWITADCGDCLKEWREVYELVAIEPTNPQG